LKNFSLYFGAVIDCTRPWSLLFRVIGYRSLYDYYCSPNRFLGIAEFLLVTNPLFLRDR